MFIRIVSKRDENFINLCENFQTVVITYLYTDFVYKPTKSELVRLVCIHKVQIQETQAQVNRNYSDQFELKKNAGLMDFFLKLRLVFMALT